MKDRIWDLFDKLRKRMPLIDEKDYAKDVMDEMLENADILYDVVRKYYDQAELRRFMWAVEQYAWEHKLGVIAQGYMGMLFLIRFIQYAYPELMDDKERMQFYWKVWGWLEEGRMIRAEKQEKQKGKQL